MKISITRRIKSFLAYYVLTLATVPKSFTRMNYQDIISIFFIGVSSLITRLFVIYKPPAIIFEEAHTGEIINTYFKHQYFLDIHPPLPKLIIYFFLWIYEYEGTIPFHMPNSDGLYPELSEFRFVPAFISALVPPLVYSIMRISTYNRIPSFLSALFIIFDTTTIIDSRLLSSNGIYNFFVVLTMFLTSYQMCVRRYTNYWYFLYYLTAISLGCTFSCKFSGIIFSFFILFQEIIFIYNEHRMHFNKYFFKNLFKKVLILYGTCFLTSYVIWIIHLSVIWYIPPKEKVYPFKPPSNLIDKTNNDHSNLTMFSSIGIQVFKEAYHTFLYNMMENKDNENKTNGYLWPLMLHPAPVYWSQEHKHIVFIGNIFVYWPAFLSVGILFISYRKQKWIVGFRFVLGYFLAFSPYLFSSKKYYSYHYVTPLIFANMCFGIVFDMFISGFWQGLLMSFVSALVIFGYAKWGTFVYGYPILDSIVPRKFLFKIWGENFIIPK